MKTLNLILAFTFLSFCSLSALTNVSPTQSHNIISGGEDTASSFYAEWKKDHVIVSWQAAEKGTYYEIEYSTDGENFEPIETENDIRKDGDFLYIIDNTTAIENYYRLMQITVEGEIVYSDIIHVSPLPVELTLEGIK